MKKKKILADPIDQKKPSLRISNIVYGREKVGTRVLYLVDQKGKGIEKKNAEVVILYRWRKKVEKGYSFSGVKLNPKIWRQLLQLLDSDVKNWAKLSSEDIQTIFQKKLDYMREHKIKVPSYNILFGLFQICGATKLQKILSRHNDPEREKNFGTPDLFLFYTNTLTKKPGKGVFVEVKKPEEPLSQDQREEIAFLKSIGLQARILRLMERG